MARTIVNIQYSLPFEETDRRIRNILTMSGYKEINRNGEMVWKKGTGFLTAMHFIKIEYNQNTVTVSGWVQAGMGSVGGNEMALEGFVAAVPKKAVMKVIMRLQDEIK